MNPIVGIGLAVLAAASVANGTFAALGPLVAPWARVAVEKVVLGFGPALLTRIARGVRVELRLVPLTAYLTFVGGNPIGEPPPPPPPPRVLWLEASPLRRVAAFVVAPRVLTLTIAALVLGPVRAVTAVATGLRDLPAAFYGARPLLDAAADTLAREGFVTLAAVALCKTVSVGLVALPTDTAHAAARRHGDGLGKVRAALMLATLVLLVAWLVAVARWAIARA